MPRAKPQKQLIEFKGNSLPIVAVTLRSLNVDALTASADELFGDESFFDGDAALLELSHLRHEVNAEEADWPAITRLFKQHGLNVIGVRGGSEELRTNAAANGLPFFAAIERASRPAAEIEEVSPPRPPDLAPPIPEPVARESVSSEPMAPQTLPTMIVDRPLRSGQQIYARDSDLVVLGAVNAGAEVIADGSIHIYAPLRGRALAGASGATDARIFTTRFEAELVSIAGVYRTFEAGVPRELASQPVQVRLLLASAEASPEAQEGETTLSIAALNTL